MYLRLKSASTEAIAQQWDRIAETRMRQLQSKSDATFWNISVPIIKKFCESINPQSILDVGCGVGVLTSQLADKVSRTVGVDASAKSIEIARRHFHNKCDFIAARLEDYSDESEEKFDLVVANMVLMDVVNLPDFAAAMAKCTRRGGRMICSITHPFFWPQYYGYSDEHWFDYSSEIIVTGPFKISSEVSEFDSTHVHRPIGTYFTEMANAGFNVEWVQEPMPSRDVERLYIEKWLFPRYIFGSFIKD